MAGEGTPDIRVATPGESGRDHIIVSPFQFYVNGEDHLRITSANSLSGVVLEISGRFFDQDTQQITPIVERQQPNTDRSIKQTLVRLGKGYLLNLAVRAVTGAPLVGQTFVIVELVRGFDGATQFLGVLGQGYVTARQGLAWPGSPIQSSIEGGGYFRVVAGTQPAAGAEVNEVCPTGARWRLVSLRVPLTTNGTAGTRQPGLSFINGATGYSYSANPGTLGVSNTKPFFWTSGMPLATAIDSLAGVAGLMREAILLAGAAFVTATASLSAGDQWGQPVYLVEEFLEVA